MIRLLCVVCLFQLQSQSSFAFSFNPLQSRVLVPLKYQNGVSSVSSVSPSSRTTSHLQASQQQQQGGVPERSSDPVISAVATRLRRANCISWWSQVILTVISSITLLFARSVLTAISGASSLSQPPTAPGGFLFAGAGVALSYLSIIWTWGGTRLSRRLRRSTLISNTNTDNNYNKGGKATKPYSRIKAATMIRRAIVIGATLNILGMLITLIGAEQIVGLLAAKVLTMQGISPFSGGMGAAGFGAAGLGAQAVQPLDVLIVQANTNTLLSHFLSLVCCLILTRSVHVLDPPSVEDDER
jgi:hypothetical protein